MSGNSFFFLLGKPKGPGLIAKYMGLFGKPDFLKMSGDSFFSLLGKPDGAKVLAAVLSEELPVASVPRRISFIRKNAQLLIECQHLVSIYSKSKLTLDEVEPIIRDARLKNKGIISTATWKRQIAKSKQSFCCAEDNSEYEPRRSNKKVAPYVPNVESVKENETTTVTNTKRKRTSDTLNSEFDKNSIAVSSMDVELPDDRFAPDHEPKRCEIKPQLFAIGSRVRFVKPIKHSNTPRSNQIVEKLERFWEESCVVMGSLRYGPGYCYSVKFSVLKGYGTIEETFLKWGDKEGCYYLDERYFKALP